MNVTKSQHVLEAAFTPIFIAASTFEGLRVFESSKEHVPKWDVREVIRVMTKLMMNAMRFGSLENETEPGGGFNVPVIEEFSDCDQDSVIARCTHAAAE